MVAIRKDLSSLAGLGTFPNREPSHKWLGYFQGRRREAENGHRDGRAPRQSPSWWPCAMVAVRKDPMAVWGGRTGQRVFEIACVFRVR